MAGPVIVSAADLHVGATSNYGMRTGLWDQQMGMPSIWAQAFKSLDQLVDLCNEESADFLTISGDTFDNGVPPAEVVAQFYDRLNRLDRTKVILVNGNHDQQRVVGKHRTPVDVYLQEHKNVLHVAEGSEVVEFDGVQFALSPWQRVAGSSAQEQASYDLRETVESLAEKITAGPSIFLAHIVTDECTFDNGSRRSSETLMSARAHEASIPTAVIDEGPWSTAQLGHIHKRQQLGDKTWYVGSTYKVTFGERDEQKGANVVRFGRGNKASVEFKPFQIRELHQLNLRDEAGRGMSLQSMNDIRRGDLVRLMTNSDAESTAEFDSVVDHLRSMDVKFDISREVERFRHAGERTASMSVDANPIDAIKAYAKQQNADEKLVDRALAELDDLLSEVE